MKTLKFRQVLLLGVFLGISTLPLNARQEVVKDFHEEYDANSQTELMLQNKYGNIDIKDWDQDRISIDVKVRVEHPNQEKAQRLLDQIQVNFSSSGNRIEVITEFDPKFGRSDWGDNKEFEILNYVFGEELDEESKKMFDYCKRLLSNDIKFVINHYLNIARTTLSLGGTGFLEPLKQKWEMIYPQGGLNTPNMKNMNSLFKNMGEK